jgi:hypothetical protein
MVFHWALSIGPRAIDLVLVASFAEERLEVIAYVKLCDDRTM